MTNLHQLEDLPTWAWDSFLAAMKHHDEHPPLYTDDWPRNDDWPRRNYVRVENCGCDPWNALPSDVKAAIRLIDLDRRRQESARIEDERKQKEVPF